MDDDNFDVQRIREELGIIVTEPQIGRRRKDLVRYNSVQAGLPEDWTRATFIVRVSLLEKLKDFAYTERISIKEALDSALELFLQDVDDLLPHNRNIHRDSDRLRISGEKTYDVKEVAAILNRTPITIYKYIHNGKMTARRVGNNFFITESSLLEFARSQSLVIENSKI